MSILFQVVVEEAAGVKKWADLTDSRAYSFHKTMGKEVRIVHLAEQADVAASENVSYIQLQRNYDALLQAYNSLSDTNEQNKRYAKLSKSHANALRELQVMRRIWDGSHPTAEQIRHCEGVLDIADRIAGVLEDGTELQAHELRVLINFVRTGKMK